MSEDRGPKAGEPAPDFCLPNQDGEQVCLREARGHWLVLYFYPKDNTSGCTREAVDFTAHLEEFAKRNAVVWGVSPDSVKSHQKFRQKHELQVTLLSDPEHTVLEAYGAWGKKKMYGREYWGVIRSTFLIDPEGQVVATWPKVKVKGHVEEVLATLMRLQENRSPA